MTQRRMIFAARLAVAILFFLGSVQGWGEARAADEIEGALTCSVEDHLVVDITNGVASRYKGFSGSYKSGDQLLLKYSLYSRGLLLAFEDPARSKLLASALADFDDLDQDHSSQILVFDSDSGRMSFGPTYIRFERLGREFFFSQYERGHWDGLYSYAEVNPNHAQITAMKCLDVVNTIDKIVDAIRRKQ